ncbi:hypothetical protein XELAEV_18003368mg [Xenopus laevis]|uniref:Uncharacterized protein n=1 Tax=Xenopus laevis TaxID=8355 RepID=A0A974BNN9_XENLA|nr:hypothetical protein XELAEV_18003368mg [Xenopus laevis]
MLPQTCRVRFLEMYPSNCISHSLPMSICPHFQPHHKNIETEGKTQTGSFCRMGPNFFFFFFFFFLTRIKILRECNLLINPVKKTKLYFEQSIELLHLLRFEW